MHGNSLPAPLAFPFHTFRPLRVPHLLILFVPALQIFLTVASWSLSAWPVSK